VTSNATVTVNIAVKNMIQNIGIGDLRRYAVHPAYLAAIARNWRRLPTT